MSIQSSLMALHSPLPLHLKVLAVDDDEDNRYLLSNFLEVLGCEVYSAHSGEETLAIVTQQPIDLILLDLVLPGIDGFETLKRLKKDARSRTIPTIAVTGLTLAQERQKIRQAGFDDYLSKPFLLIDLEQLLRRQTQQYPALITE